MQDADRAPWARTLSFHSNKREICALFKRLGNVSAFTRENALPHTLRRRPRTAKTTGHLGTDKDGTDAPIGQTIYKLLVAIAVTRPFAALTHQTRAHHNMHLAHLDSTSIPTLCVRPAT